ncbi:nitroreductase family deazaflavin-dependent oxidoreductase [Actinophytocola xinjiangensis]|uniref:nitroreductase family deazaflavin-dependent oxidoreductase n=1 Tax=Actinophytocola xinjiangensis TaxID=485602 RepID=UPI000B07AC4E|nr:nitroreductase family deazaflavin-dependent oxidoreductase [Actinophytocola xinjiangensis]
MTTYRRSRALRVGDTIVGWLIWTGLVPNGYLLTTVGRRTGRERTTPVAVVAHEGRRWLVSPYGAVAWVFNARAHGSVVLRRRFTRREYTVRELPAQEAGPVLRRYYVLSAPSRPYINATKDSPVERFVAQAPRHPVFELTPR